MDDHKSSADALTIVAGIIIIGGLIYGGYAAVGSSTQERSAPPLESATTTAQ